MLERISQESEREYYWPIMETSTAFVRERAPWPPRQVLANPFVQLQGSTAGERSGESTAEQSKNKAKQASIQVWPATDIQAVLTVLGRRDEKAREQDRATNQNLHLGGTDLRGADLIGAHLEGALLASAHLEGARLARAHLEGADLPGAHLEGAFIRVKNLTQEQVNFTQGDEKTRLPAGLTRPAHWQRNEPAG